MQTPEYIATWGAGISETDLSAALAAAGILAAVEEMEVPFPDDLPRLVQAIQQPLVAARNQKKAVRWAEPDFLGRGGLHHASAALLASAWKASKTAEPEEIRVEMHMASLRNLSWYAAKLVGESAGIKSFYVFEKPLSAYLDWHWPIRIGIYPGVDSEQLAQQLRDWCIASYWARPLVQVVDPGVSNSVLDILILPDISVLANPSGFPSCEANFLIGMGINEAGLPGFVEEMRRLANLSQAKAFAFTELSGQAPVALVEQILYDLTHNGSIDVILRGVHWPGGNAAWTYLFASNFFINAIRPIAMASRLGEEMKENPDPVLRELVDMAVSFNLVKPQPPPVPAEEEEEDVFRGGEEGPRPVSPEPLAVDPAELINGIIGKIPYNREVDGATFVSKLSQVVDRARKETSGGEVRHLQHQLADETNPASPVQIFDPAARYLLRIRIGPIESEWVSLDEPFPDDLLPQTSSGHLLTVILSEPNHLSEALTGTIFYPARGASSTCDFRFSVSADFPRFEGRVLILYQNRVLQTALLSGPVRMEGRKRQGKASIEFALEGVVRSANQPLSGRQSFGAAFLFNHSPSGQARVVSARGNAVKQLSLESLPGIETLKTYISGMFNATEWESKQYGGLDTPQTLTLLRSLAQNGWELFNILMDEGIIPAGLGDNEPVQVVIAREGDYYPIDFCYQSSDAPSSTAQLCPHWKENLEQGTVCSGAYLAGVDQTEVICPAAFWGLRRVIEWQRIPAEQAGEAPSTNEPGPGREYLHPLAKILIGASNRVPKPKVKDLETFISDDLKAMPIEVSTWSEWKEKIRTETPDVLVLMVHTKEENNGLPNMELQGKFRDPPNISVRDVDMQKQMHPLVLLLGCGTLSASIPMYNLVARLRRANAGVVVGTIAELLDVHAPMLARDILEGLAAKGPPVESTIGELILRVKRKGLLNGHPIALALQAYGDADWKVKHVSN